MDFRDEVRILYICGDYETGPIRKMRGIIIDENTYFYTIAKIEKTIILSKRFIVKVEDFIGQIMYYQNSFDIMDSEEDYCVPLDKEINNVEVIESVGKIASLYT